MTDATDIPHMLSPATAVGEEQLRAVRENTHKVALKNTYIHGLYGDALLSMKNAADTLDDIKRLEFAESQSKTVGVHGSFVDKMRANSVRIVGSMKFVADMFIGFSGDPFLIGYAVFSGIGRLIMMGYGTKANQQKEAAKAAGKEPEQVSTLYKILHPSKYPVEAAAGSSMVGEASAGIFGAQLIRNTLSPDHYKGWPIFLCELFAVYSYGNLVFSQEKKKNAQDEQESLVFTQSDSKPVGVMGRMKEWAKEHPVVVSSILNVGIGLTMMLYSTGVPYFIGATILLAANILQALLVKKREFNVEGALEDRKATAQKSPSPDSPAEPKSTIQTAQSVDERIQRDGNGVMIPA